MRQVRERRRLQPRRLMPLGMLIVHALECVPVNEETLRFFPAQIAPLLLMAAFLRVRGAKERAGGIGLGWIDLLCVGALLLSLRGLNQMVLAPVNGMPSPVDVEPLFMLNAPDASVSMDAPGASVPLTATAPLMLPVPPRVPPFTVTALLPLMLPFTSRLPAFTVVAPV